MPRVLHALAAACLLFWATEAAAHLSINKLWLDFAAGHADRDDIVIRNDGADRYYVTVTVSEILNPGSPEEKRVEEADPEVSGLLVTPNRLVLDPGALRSIRVVSLNQGLKKDRVYRILISPQVGQIDAKQVKQQDQRGLAIKMLAAYDVLVIAKPQDARSDLVAKREAGDVVLSNQGNSNILLADMRVCPPGFTGDPTKSADCTAVESQRLYSGNSFAVPIKAPDDRVFVKTRSGAGADFEAHQF